MSKMTNVQLSQQVEGLTTLIKDSVAELKKINQETKAELTGKIDELTAKVDEVNATLRNHDRRIDDAINSIVELQAKVDNANDFFKVELKTITDRVKKVEDKVGPLENLPNIIQTLKEEAEDRTNRQLRETLIFKNIPEELEKESWEDTKRLLATIISRFCDSIEYDDAYKSINRCHREKAIRPRNDDRPTREGKRHIFAAFHSWNICQTFIEAIRKKCASDRDSKIYVEQMYGPMTTKRRSLAMQCRKQLKDEGLISGGYVDFPAKLFVNRMGNVDAEGKKIFNFHSDFSKRDVV